MKPDQERVRGLLTDTVTLLCKNGLQYNKELRVQGLLGITLDNDDVFVVHINEVFDELVGGQLTGITSGDITNSAIGTTSDSVTSHVSPDVAKSRKGIPQKHDVPRTSSPVLKGSNKRKANLKSMNPPFRIKKEEEEEEDDIVIMESKQEQDSSSKYIPAPSDLPGDNGEGDREAMRISYVGANSLEEPPAKRQATKETGSFDEGNRTQADVLTNSSLNDSQLSLQDGQMAYTTDTPGCSAWDSSQEQSALLPDEQQQGAGSQDSLAWIYDDANQSAVGGCGDGGAYSTHTNRRMIQVRRHPNPALSMRRPTNPDLEDKPFGCTFPNCDKRYYFRKDLRRHERFKHGRHSSCISARLPR